MANNQEVIQWYLQNTEVLKLRARRLTWTNWWCPGWDDIEISLQLNHTERFFGRGFAKSTDGDLAFLKAGSEAIERLACAGAGISTQGVAVHSSLDEARLNARLELHERQSYARSDKGRMRRPLETGNSPLIVSLLQQAKKLNIEIQFTQLCSPTQFAIILCESSTPAENQFFGLGASLDPTEAVEKAGVELIRNLAAGIESRKADSPLKNRGRKYAEKFRNVRAIAKGLFDTESDEFTFETINLHGLLGIDCPLRAERCRIADNNEVVPRGR